MWILHQDKETILNIDNAVSVEYSFNALLEKEHGIAYCADSKVINSCVVMGIYPSKERCLEVIQDIAKNIRLKKPTYEMPEK